MSACTMILSLCVVLLHRVMRVEVDSRTFVESERNATRLSHQFRNDVHQALAVQPKASEQKDGLVLQIQLPEARVVDYRYHEGRVLRTRSSNGKVEAREEFAFSPACKLAVQRLPSPDRIALTITSASLDQSASQEEQLRAYRAIPLALQLEAVVSRNAEVLAQNITTEQGRAK